MPPIFSEGWNLMQIYSNFWGICPELEQLATVTIQKVDEHFLWAKSFCIFLATTMGIPFLLSPLDVWTSKIEPPSSWNWSEWGRQQKMSPKIHKIRDPQGWSNQWVNAILVVVKTKDIPHFVIDSIEIFPDTYFGCVRRFQKKRCHELMRTVPQNSQSDGKGTTILWA